jgi:hypothetical protein
MFSLPSGYKELYKHTCLLSIPGAIDNYNYHIDRVDIIASELSELEDNRKDCNTMEE